MKTYKRNLIGMNSEQRLIITNETDFQGLKIYRLEHTKLMDFALMNLKLVN